MFHNIHPQFDGHLEKPISKMGHRERLHYLWLQMVFRHKIKGRKVLS